MDFVSPPAPGLAREIRSRRGRGRRCASAVEEMQGNLVLSRFWKTPPSADCAGKSATLGKNPRHRSHSTHPRRLKLALKLHHCARLRREDPLQMLHRLQHRFGLRAHRWSQRPAQPGPHHRPLPALTAALGGIGIIARKQTVAVERAAPSAMRTRPALQRKSSLLNSPASRTKQNGTRGV